MPELDQSLAADCGEVRTTNAMDYDEWQKDNAAILAILTDCAIRHRKLVQAWPK